MSQTSSLYDALNQGKLNNLSSSRENTLVQTCSFVNAVNENNYLNISEEKVKKEENEEDKLDLQLKIYIDRRLESISKNRDDVMVTGACTEQPGQQPSEPKDELFGMKFGMTKGELFEMLKPMFYTEVLYGKAALPTELCSTSESFLIKKRTRRNEYKKKGLLHIKF